MSQKDSLSDCDVDLYVDVFIYFFTDTFLKESGYQETKTSAAKELPKMSGSEILFVFVTACREYGGNYEKALKAALRHNLIKARLSRSQFNGRLKKWLNSIITYWLKIQKRNSKREFKKEIYFFKSKSEIRKMATISN